MSLSRNRIRDLLERHDLGPSRALGQNFLCDQGMVDRIVRLADVGPGHRVVEIGPGLGSLTAGLCASGAAVTAVEIDRHLIPALRDHVGHYEQSGRLTILHADVRKLDWAAVLGGPEGGPWSVVANLPYNIATPLILDLLAAQPRLERWLVMVQKEAGERLVAEPGSKIYGIPSVLLAHWARARLVGSVPAELFLPRPRVASVLVRIERHETGRGGAEPADDVDFDLFSRLVRTAFGQRRKMLRRSLDGHVSADQMETAGIAPTRRPEELGLDQWRRLTTVVAGVR